MIKKQLLLILSSLLSLCLAGTPAPVQWFNQTVHHKKKDPSDTRTYPQRYYTSNATFGGPGHPIFLVLGGESSVPPERGLIYPVVDKKYAPHFQAFVLAVEHRFYGASQPVSESDIQRARHQGLPDPREVLLTYEQALLDAVAILQATRVSLGCSLDASNPMYCPAITVGGSYPGFLSFMGRRMFPHIIDMSYAASAPVKFYAQQVDQYQYYNHIATVADAIAPNCSAHVKDALNGVSKLIMEHGSDFRSLDIGNCGTIPDYIQDSQTFRDELFMMVAYTFANHNMAFYPPNTHSKLYQSCQMFASSTNNDDLTMLRNFLVYSLAHSPHATCFDMHQQLPSGERASISGGDWSGVGTGPSGDSWDFQTCTLCVEAIGMASMFPHRPWSMEWLTQHCRYRFGVTPNPLELDRSWGISDIKGTGVTRVLFTNGLNDGWSVSGIQENVSETVLAINFATGAHHSELSGMGPLDKDTEEVSNGYEQIQSILEQWLNDLPSRQATMTASFVGERVVD